MRSRRGTFAIHLTSDVCYTTADPISTKGYILGLPQLNLLCTSSWHKGNVGSCGTNLLIPHSAKGLRLLDQPDRRFARQVVPEHGDRRSVVGKLGHIVNEKMWMEWGHQKGRSDGLRHELNCTSRPTLPLPSYADIPAS